MGSISGVEGVDFTSVLHIQIDFRVLSASSKMSTGISGVRTTEREAINLIYS